MRTLADISDEIHAYNLEIEGLNKKIKAIEKKVTDLEAELKLAAETQGLTAGKGTTSTFELKEETVPQASDWDDFYQFIHHNKYYHLLQKRPAVKACAELWELGKTIPGVNKFTSVKVKVKGV